MNAKNLKNPATRPPEERRELARRAGLASVKKRREQKSLREIMNELLALPLNENDPTDRDILKWLDVDGDPDFWEDVGLTKKLGICAAMIRLAMRGNIRAAILILKITGEYPTERREVHYKVTPPGRLIITPAIPVTYVDSDGTILNTSTPPRALSYEEAGRMIEEAQESAAGNC